jgi:hypothetical protein
MPGRGNRLGRRRPAFGSGHVSSAGLAPTLSPPDQPRSTALEVQQLAVAQNVPNEDEAKADVFDSLSGSIIPSADTRRSAKALGLSSKI